jgi:Cyclin D1 binding domain
MYLAHTPYWFLARHKIWFSDSPHHGKLLVARYSAARRCIEAYALVAERGHLDLQFWSYNPEVIIHTFTPKVQLHLDQPVLRINAANHRNFPSDDHRFQREIMMDTHRGPEGAAVVFNLFMLSRPIPPAALGPQTQVWPPLKLPAAERTRNQSADGFRTSGHRPTRLSEISEHTFRIRKWMEFPNHAGGISMRVGEGVNTYATLPPECYTPTLAKPWRGIWVGDYAGHGCEFLAILQPNEPVKLPEDVMDIIARMPRSTSVGSGGSSDGSWQTALSTMINEDEDFVTEAANTEWMGLLPQEHQSTPLSNMSALGLSSQQENIPDSAGSAEQSTRERLSHDVRQYSGQLLAVKLTGDPNVPRGEYTFVAPDIGPKGTIRIAEEDIFKGARVIRSCGHIASTGFIDGT